MKKMRSKYVYLIMCIVFAISIIVIGISFTYALIIPNTFGTDTASETSIKTGNYNQLESSLTSASSINASNIYPIDESQIDNMAPALMFTAKTTSTNSSKDKFNIYLKDVAISTNFIDSDFKWEVLQDGEIIAHGDFSNIETVGKKSTSRTDTETMKYFDNYYLKNNGSFNGNELSNYIVRVYLLDDDSNQNNLTNGIFESKVAIEGYKSN